MDVLPHVLPGKLFESLDNPLDSLLQLNNIMMYGLAIGVDVLGHERHQIVEDDQIPVSNALDQVIHKSEYG